MTNKEKAVIITALAAKVEEINKLLAKGGMRVEFSQTAEGLLQAKVMK